MPTSPSAPTSVVFRRGEAIYKAGQLATHVFLIQSGLVIVKVARGEKNIEIAQVGASQVLGEEALWGSTAWSATAVANNDVNAIAIEVGAARAVLAGGTQLAKVFTRGIMEKLRNTSDTLVAIRLQGDALPCPSDKVVKLFATLHTVASYTGERKKGEQRVTVTWAGFRKYAQRNFLESPVRLEHVIYLLAKLGIAELGYIPCETDPDAPDELGYVYFRDLNLIRDFYQLHRKRLAGTGGDDQSPASDVYDQILAEIELWNTLGKVDPPVQEGARDAADAA